MISVRERCFDFLCEKVRTMREGQPVSDPYDFTPDLFKKEPLDTELTKGKRLAIGMHDDLETKVARVGYYECQARIAIEIHMSVQHYEETWTLLRKAVANIERRVQEDLTIGGYGHHVELIENQISDDLDPNNMAQAVLFIYAQYRHKTQRPDKRVFDP